jgi:hypothetical protein
MTPLSIFGVLHAAYISIDRQASAREVAFLGRANQGWIRRIDGVGIPSFYKYKV